VQLVGMSLYGIETWTERGDAFAVFFGLPRTDGAAALGGSGRRRGEVYLRPPFVGALSLELLPGTIAMVIAMIGTTSFDGFSNASRLAERERPVLRPPEPLHPHRPGRQRRPHRDELAGTVGLLAMVGVIAGFFRLGILGMRSIGARYGAPELTRSFAHTLLPIAIAYFVAHYFSLLAFSGQWMIQLVSDPLGNGANIFGTANFQPNYALADRQLPLVRAGRGARDRPRRRHHARARPRADALPRPPRRNPLAVLDAHRDGGVHLPRVVDPVVNLLTTGAPGAGFA
jgi:hypothetical protein